MKIVILTLDDYFFLPTFFKVFLRKKASQVVYLLILSPRGYYKSATRTLRNALVLYGIIGLLRLFIMLIFKKIASLFAYLVKNPGLCSSVKILARLYNIPYRQIADIGGEKVVELLKSIKPDIIFSVSLPQLIPARLFSVPKYGIFNIHTSLLPKYRGVLPVFWALLNGETKIGSTVHMVNEKIDYGDIIVQDTFEVEAEDTLEKCMEKGKVLGANLAIRCLELIERGTMEATKKDYTGARYYSFPTRKDVINFKKKRRLY